MPESTRADRANTIQDDSGRAAAPTPLAELRLAPGTRYTCDRALLGLDRWLDGRPLTDGSLADHLGALFDRGLAPASAATAVAAVQDRARRQGEASPAGARTEAALSAFRRDGAGRGPGQVVGIRWGQADRMARLAESCGNARGLRDALLIRIMSDCLLRVSEAEALDVSDVEFVRDGLLVTIRRSKTDQEGRGAALFAGPETARLARKWFGTARVDGGPLFRPVNKAGRVAGTRLSGRSVRDIVKERAADAGIEGRVSGHSLRVGSAQSLRDAGATVTELMDAGRWTRVDTMAGYVRAQDAAVGAVARLRYGVVPPDAGVRGARRAPRHGARRARVEGKRAKRERKQMRRAAKKVEKRLARIEKAVTGS